MIKKTFFSEWWPYLGAVGFILLGIYYLKLWKKSRTPVSSIWEKATGEWFNLTTGIFLIASGVMFIIISIIQDCTGWVAK